MEVVVDEDYVLRVPEALDFSTVSAPIDLNAYLRLLPRDGTLVSVGAPSEPLPVAVFSLFGRRGHRGRGWGVRG